MRAVVAVWLCCVGCIDDDLVRCANDVLCPVGHTCDLVRASCISPEQRAACDAVEDAAPCEAGTLVGGCYDGVCHQLGCGNFIAEPTEQCDDGNTSGEDGCSADCTSNETCGNGVVDPAEDCDDGNLMSHDACDSRCIAETEAWTVVPIAPSYFQNAAYDAVRMRLVTTTFDAVWELADDQWSVVPTPRRITLVHWDPSRQRVVGTYETYDPDDFATRVRLMSWDGAVWTALPGNRRLGIGATPIALTYDEARDQTILVADSGGASSMLVWGYSASSTWVNLPDVPEALYDVELARDGTDVILLGTTGAAWKQWVFNGTTWTAGTAPASTSSSYAFARYQDKLHALHRASGTIYVRNTGTWQVVPALAYPNNAGRAELFHDLATDELATATEQRIGHLRAGTWRHTLFPALELSTLVSHGRDLVIVGSPSSTVLRTWQLVGTALEPFATTGLMAGPVRCTTATGRDAVVCINDSGETAALLGTTWMPLASPTTELEAISALGYDPSARRLIVNKTIEPDAVLALADDATTWTTVTAPPDGVSFTSASWDARNQTMLLTGWISYDEGGARVVYELRGDALSEVSAVPNGALLGVPSARDGTLFLIGNELFERRDTSIVEHGVIPLGSVTAAAYVDGTGTLALMGEEHSGTMIALRSLSSPTPNESCAAGADDDGDGLSACADPDCYWAEGCSHCPPHTSCRF